MGEKNGVDLLVVEPRLMKSPGQAAPAKTKINQDTGVFRGNVGAITAAPTAQDRYFHAEVECIS